MHFRWRNWHYLSKKELYDVIQLRLEVFSVEQNCPYQDLDGQDLKAMHLLAYDDAKLVGYLRLFETYEKYFGQSSLGRVCTAKSHRKKSLGKQMMRLALEYSDEHFSKNIQISAQQYLEKFYQNFGFVTLSGPYLEDGIAHIEMIRKYEK